MNPIAFTVSGHTDLFNKWTLTLILHIICGSIKSKDCIRVTDYNSKNKHLNTQTEDNYLMAFKKYYQKVYNSNIASERILYTFYFSDIWHASL